VFEDQGADALPDEFQVGVFPVPIAAARSHWHLRSALLSVAAAEVSRIISLIAEFRGGWWSPC